MWGRTSLRADACCCLLATTTTTPPPHPPTNRDVAKEIQCLLEYTTLAKIVARSEIW
jgi:hypothetical protein